VSVFFFQSWFVKKHWNIRDTLTGNSNPCFRYMKVNQGKSDICLLLKILLWITISMENSRRDLFIDMVVDRFISKNNQITLYRCITFISKTGVGLPGTGLVFTVRDDWRSIIPLPRFGPWSSRSLQYRKRTPAYRLSKFIDFKCLVPFDLLRSRSARLGNKKLKNER